MAPQPTTIYLYDDPDAAGLDVDYLGQWLAERLPEVPIHVRSDFLTHHLARFGEPEGDVLSERLQEELEACEVDNLVHPEDRERLPADDPAERGWDLLYDGARLQEVFGALIPDDEAGAGDVHLVFTMHYLGVWPGRGVPLRLAVELFGQPHLLSVSGLIEGLDLPRRYHFLRQQFALFGAGEHLDDLADQFEEETLGYGDARLNEVWKGYLLQALFQQFAGEAGCPQPRCRAHVATDHRATLRLQTGSHPGLCARHEKLLRSWGGLPE